MNRLIFYFLLSFIFSCVGWTDDRRKLVAENSELENIKPINICEIDKSSKYIKATIATKHSDIQKNKSFQKVERLETIACYSQPYPKKLIADMTPWGTRLYFDFTHFYGLANGYPGDEYSLTNEAEKNCGILLSDYYSNYKNYRVSASCGSAKCQVCEY